ncbi:hypothetical protein HPP92_025208 [Vanilla planifolia]|uniref:O-methyltransferase dimerisation domain-containing protein n=1 Tax=Vanilla planifolia TaxID=51239 RepID=A0A835PIM6_VANPL|nr:hypothetical protein HPP92_025473 [Vanilla planifolia]KAG0453904.1 hypothetical protein HPP92_025208 [Vanilla planifolia]
MGVKKDSVHSLMEINSQMEGTIQMSQARASNGYEEEESMVINKILGVIDSMVIKCAVKLHVFDAIHRHGRPISLDDLAGALPVQCSHPASLGRIMRSLGHMGLVDIQHQAVGEDGEEEEFYTLTAASFVFLREESEHSLAPYVRFILEEDMRMAKKKNFILLRQPRLSSSEKNRSIASLLVSESYITGTKKRHQRSWRDAGKP